MGSSQNCLKSLTPLLSRCAKVFATGWRQLPCGINRDFAQANPMCKVVL